MQMIIHTGNRPKNFTGPGKTNSSTGELNRDAPQLRFWPQGSAREAAVALVNGLYYIIGIPACQFDFKGKHFVAMSPDASFYRGIYGE